jgi:hypothetical protein
MRTIGRAVLAILLFAPGGAAFGDTPTNAFAEVFNAAAAGDQIDKTIKLDRCNNGIISTWCQYTVSEHTIIVVSGRKSNALARNVTVATSPKGDPIKADAVKPLFAAEDEVVWPILIKIFNPELSPEQRNDMVSKFAASIRDGQASFTTKIGVNRYSAIAAPDMGIWMVANLRSRAAPSDVTWLARWRQRVDRWIKK